MDDVKKKLEIDNTFIKIQAINSLLSSVEKNKPTENAINGSTPKIEELDFLWDLTDNDCPVVSNCASQALVSLALRSIAEVGYVINGILNKLTSAKRMNGLITAVKNILLAQANDPQLSSCYKNRLTQHPFVVILRQNSVAWPHLLEQVKFMLTVDEKRDEIFEILIPFFQYVLLDPNNPPSLSVLRTTLHRILVDNFQRYHEKNVLEFLFLNLKWLRVESVTELEESCEMLQNLSLILLRGDNNFENESHLNYLVLSLTAVICRMMTVDLDPSTALQTLLDLILKINVTYNYLSDGISLLIGQMLEISTSIHHNILTRIIDALITQGWTSPLIRSTFHLPLLHVVSFPPSCTVYINEKSSAQKQASCLIKEIEKDVNRQSESLQKSFGDLQVNLLNFSALDSSVAYALQFSLVAHKVQHSPQIALWWLENIQSKLNLINHDWHFLSHLLAGITIHGFQDRQLVKKVVSVIISLAQADKKQAHNLFPLLLHKIGTEKDIDIRLHILHSLPDIATHKICIGPVLQTLNMLSSTPHLQSLSLRLTTKLWQHQDRVFPFLHHLILEKDDDKQSEAYDGIVAKAASLKDICETRPQQFGADCLPSLSYILAKNLNEAGVVPSVLALDGIIALCKEEVIDLRTTWKVLSPKLHKDHRPLVIRKLCELVSLAPGLEVESNEYDSFKSEVVAWLWKQIVANKDPLAVGAAYRSLGVFPTDLYKFKSLPEKAKENLTLPSNLAATPFEQAKKPEDVLTEIPGSCFTSLLDSVHPNVILDYGQFLSSQIKMEVKELPRGVYHSALRTNRVTQGNKVLAAVPGLLTNKHEYNKIPGLQGSLAGGVLLSYEPEVEYGSNAQPLKRSFANQARSYQTKLQVLLNEVPIGAAEWQRSLALSQAWTAYMERAYFISVEGRKAELEMQQKHGTLKSPDDFAPLTKNAWLWARDTICDIFRGSAKGKPAAQGNTILALGGLAAAVAKFTTTLDPESWNKDDSQGSEHLPHSTWMAITTETILNVVASGRPPKGRIFNWFQSSDKNDKSSLSMLVRACGAVSISQLTPYLANNDSAKITEIAGILETTLRTSESPALQLYAGLGLGYLLMHLYQQRYAQSGGQEAGEFLSQTAKSLLQWAFSDDMDNKVGSVIGLTTAACAMCLDTNLETRLNAADIQSMMMEKIESEDEASVIHEVLCLSVVCVTAVACTTNLLTMETAETVLLKLESLLKSTPNNCGIAAALGLLIYWLQRMSYPNSTEMKDHLLKVWLPALASEQASTLTRLAAIHGLCSLFGVQSTLMLLPDSFLQNDSRTGLNELLNIMSQIISLSKDIGMQNCSAWMLGQLYSVCSREGSARSNLPCNYSYLNNTSILRAVVDYITEYNKNGNFESAKCNSTLHVCLGALAQTFQRPLPPLDWAALLSPIFQHVHDCEVQKTALQIAVNQSSSSPAAAALVTSMISENVFPNLAVPLKIYLFESLPQMLKSISVAKLNNFVNEFVTSFKGNEKKETCLPALNGLKLAVQSSDKSAEVTKLLEEAAENIYIHISHQNQELFDVFCEIAEYLSDKILDKTTTVHMKKPNEIIKSISLRCYLVKNGKQPLTWLNDVMEVAATSQCNKTDILTIVFNNLQSIVNENTDACVTWLLEIMGTTKNILNWKSPLAIENTDHMCQVVNFFVELFGCAVVSWASRTMCIPVCLFSGQIKLMELFPLAFPLIFKFPSFEMILNKVIDWFVYLIEKEGVLTTLNAEVLKAGLLSVRQTKQLSKAVIWTRVLHL